MNNNNLTTEIITELKGELEYQRGFLIKVYSRTLTLFLDEIIENVQRIDDILQDKEERL